MAKQLKLWNGRGHGKYKRYDVYIAAYSIKEAVLLLNHACDTIWITSQEINNYYSKGCWGDEMDHIVPTDPCVYVFPDYGNPERKTTKEPIRII